VVNGTRKSLPLTVIPLSPDGTFGVTHEWPAEGTWAIQLVATNPEYQNYATSVLIPVRHDSVQFPAAKHYYHAPTAAEVASALNRSIQHPVLMTIEPKLHEAALVRAVGEHLQITTSPDAEAFAILALVQNLPESYRETLIFAWWKE